MRRLALLCCLAWSSLAPAQPPGRSIHKDKTSGAEVELVDHPWRPDVFAALESAADVRGPAPLGLRPPDDLVVPVDRRDPPPPGRYVLVLAPKTGGIPMTLELRRGDGREIFADLAAMATPSAAETVYKSAAKFEAGTDPVPVLDITLAGWSDGIVLTVRYGNRKLTKELARASP